MFVLFDNEQCKCFVMCMFIVVYVVGTSFAYLCEKDIHI